jgi:two-component system, OmpR family, response regulator
MGLKLQTAMIIDDDDDLGRLLAHILEEKKIYAMVVNTLTEAETYLAYLKPTMIFLDNSFPEGLGINFIKNIRLVDDEIKIIMMTGDSAQWIEEKALDEGASFFLKKPLSKKIIDHTLERIQSGKA